MTGGTGNDTYHVDDVGDVVIENSTSGSDDLILASISATMASFVERMTLLGVQDLNGIGNSRANLITGNAGSNLLDGRGGSDTLVGGEGDDQYVVDLTTDIVVEQAEQGTDTVLADFSFTLGAFIENLELTGVANIQGNGNAADNSIVGNLGNNKLKGLGGADTLTGGAGADTLTGGGECDVFVFTSGSGHDVITDFAATGDALDTLLLSFGPAFGTADAILAAAAQVGSNTVITIDQDTTITLQNIEKASLQVGSFLLD